MSILDDLLKPPAKTVKPRVRTYQPLPVVAIADGEIITENGELLTQDQLIQRLPTMPPTLFVAVMAARFLSELDRQYSQTTVGWQYRITNNERNVSTPEGQLIATRITVAISYFGWKNRNYHKLIDPVTMYGHSLDRIWPGDGSRASRLLQWGGRAT